MRQIAIMIGVLAGAFFALVRLLAAAKDYSEVPQFLKDLSDTWPVKALAADNLAATLLLLAAFGIIYLTMTVDSPAIIKLMQRITGIFAPAGQSAGPAAAMTPPAEAVRDTWFQHAAFYTAFGYWPDASKPIFDGEQCQVPEGEHNKLLDALQKLHQSAAEGGLTVWGKIPGSSGRPRQNSVFQKIPATHWLDHAVAYMDVLGEDPSLVRTTKDHEYSPDSWCALQVSKAKVERLWHAGDRSTAPPSGAPFDEYRLDEYGRHHTVNAVLYNGGQSRIDGVKLYRTYVPEGSIQTQKVLLCGPVSLAGRQRQPVAIAGYNESEAIAAENRRIVLAAPSAGFNASTMLPPGRYSLILEADLIDGFAFKANCRLWVDHANSLRLENLENPSSSR